jgi:PhoH-like ATPase
LDTNAASRSHAIYRFEKNLIVIPVTVIEEIDKFKKDMNETGRNARHVSRLLDSLRTQGSIAKGVTLESGGILRVEVYEDLALKALPPGLHGDQGDNRILAVAMDLKLKADSGPVILVSKDTNLRIKADALGLIAEDYESDKVEIEDLYTGTADIKATADQVDRFYGQGWLEGVDSLLPNQFVTLYDESNQNHTGIGRFNARTTEFSSP